jgi:hypothetical protein
VKAVDARRLEAAARRVFRPGCSARVPQTATQWYWTATGTTPCVTRPRNAPLPVGGQVATTPGLKIDRGAPRARRPTLALLSEQREFARARVRALRCGRAPARPNTCAAERAAQVRPITCAAKRAAPRASTGAYFARRPRTSAAERALLSEQHLARARMRASRSGRAPARP